ncbi:MAG: glycosyltransferase [Desulfamplus sp.]|nr:glycosyltransferase [Desulfamplus sp.]
MKLHNTDKKILLLYDFLAVRGGAERVLLTLYQALDAHVCVGFVSRDSFGDEISARDLIDLKAQSRFGPVKIARVLGAFSRVGKNRKTAGSYTTRIYAGSYSVLAFSRDHPGQSIYYCHTPPRFMYDLREMYMGQLPFWQRPLVAGLRRWLLPRYEAAVKGMDCVVANSENVRRRLKRYVGVDARVIHPPVDTRMFRWLGQKDYFLSTARLEPLKRVDRIVLAFLDMPDQHLVVASGGSDEELLRTMAGDAPNIRFTGWQRDIELATLTGNARATIYLPLDEDFGMSPVESMAAGKPVIGVAEGGILETVVDGKTGVLLHPDFTIEDIRDAVKEMTASRALSMRPACEARASMFTRERFLDSMEKLILRLGCKVSDRPDSCFQGRE